MKVRTQFPILLSIIILSLGLTTNAGQVAGDLHPWHTITVTFDGPETSESYPSAFLNNRLTVTFRHREIEYVLKHHLQFAGSGAFKVKWFDPRNGGELQSGSVPVVVGGGSVSLGRPPSEKDKDWAVLLWR